MTEKPILFNTEMVKAILEGRKTMTRRVIKPQPHEGCGHIRVEYFFPTKVDRHGEEYPGAKIFGAHSDDGEWGCKCPYAAGDRLWVRETYNLFSLAGVGDEEEIVLRYKAGGLSKTFSTKGLKYPFKFEKWQPSIFMPRWASRIILEITSIRAERVQDISISDLEAEGLETLTRPNGKTLYTAPQCGDRPPYWESSANEAFMWLWDSIYAKRGYPWSNNDWVFPIEFKVVDHAIL